VTAGLPPIETIRRERNGATVEWFLVPWDSEVFGFPVAQVERFELGPDGDPAVLRDVAEWCVEKNVRLVSCRLDHLSLRESMALESLGFRFVEMVYQPVLDGLADVARPAHPIAVEPAGPRDLERIEEVAYEAFGTGRFVLDPRLDSDLGRRRYARWVRTSLESSGQSVLKAEIDGEVAGFFIVEERPDRSVYWHLTAIAPAFQGRGVGRSLWLTMLERHRAAGATSVRTTISAHNPRAINLYARLGFTFGAPQMTFHWLRDPVH
jgi:ribosomal protein S18 acetylase RimI-like enzyme